MEINKSTPTLVSAKNFPYMFVYFCIFCKMAAERKQSYKSENVLRMFFANESSSSESPDSDEHFQQYIGMIA